MRGTARPCKTLQAMFRLLIPVNIAQLKTSISTKLLESSNSLNTVLDYEHPMPSRMPFSLPGLIFLGEYYKES